MTSRFLCASVLTCALLSCEDKALVQENEELLEQIADSEARVTMLEEEMGENPGDQSEKLNQHKKSLSQAEEKLAGLRAATAEVTAERKAVTREFQQYRAKYPLK